MDQNKYVNAYIDNAMALVHEQVNTILQLKTASKIANDLVIEKDQIISQLTSRIEELQNQINEDSQLKEKAGIWEESYKAMSNKVSHMDTLSKQIVEMKTMIQERERQIVELESQIDKLKQPTSKKLKVKKIEPPQAQNTKDDF